MTTGVLTKDARGNPDVNKDKRVYTIAEINKEKERSVFLKNFPKTDYNHTICLLIEKQVYQHSESTYIQWCSQETNLWIYQSQVALMQ